MANNQVLGQRKLCKYYNTSVLMIHNMVSLGTIVKTVQTMGEVSCEASPQEQARKG